MGWVELHTYITELKNFLFIYKDSVIRHCINKVGLRKMRNTTRNYIIRNLKIVWECRFGSTATCRATRASVAPGPR